MAKIYQIEMYIVDVNDSYADFGDIINDIENSTEITTDCFNVKQKDIEWHDDIDINFMNSTAETYRKYFK